MAIRKELSYIKNDLPRDIRVYAHTNRRKLYKLARYYHSKYPSRITVDIVNACNLRCPLCSIPPHITAKLGKFMGMETFGKIMSKLDVGMEISFGHSGEALLHPEFFTLVDSIRGNWYVSLTTNGTLVDDRVIGSGIGRISISIDGWSPESYERYRVGAKFEDTKRRLTNLLAHPRRPHVTVRWLMTSYNEHEWKQARKEMFDMGVDKVKANPLNLGEYHGMHGPMEQHLHWIPKVSSCTYYRGKRPDTCDTWKSPVIRMDGEVLLCCVDVEGTVKLGNVLNGPTLKQLWDTPEYTEIRKQAERKQAAICKRCMK